MQYDIRHNPKNVIDLDAPSEEDVPEKSDNSEGELEEKTVDKPPAG